MKWVGLVGCLALVAAACGDDDGGMDAGGDAGVDALMMDGDVDSEVGPDAGDACVPRNPADIPEPGTCNPAADDYAICADDSWPECVSDFGEYVRIEDSISTIARVGAFEMMAPLLFDPTRDPTSEQFTMARDLYQEEEGLDSRVVRRYDPHYDVPAGTDCTLAGMPEMFPDYCVGPAMIQPILLGAFADGAAGTEPRQNAARIEAGILWFLYVSTFKESLTCTTTPKDCDSAYAYYTGGAEARGGLGLARYVMEADAYAHDRAWDGLLAVRCWRDLDPDATATMLELRDRARNQYDRAVLDGTAALVAARLRRVADTSGDEQLAHWAFVQVLGQALRTEYPNRSLTDAEAFATAIESDTPATDAADLADAIDLAFACP